MMYRVEVKVSAGNNYCWEFGYVEVTTPRSAFSTHTTIHNPAIANIQFVGQTDQTAKLGGTSGVPASSAEICPPYQQQKKLSDRRYLAGAGMYLR